MSTRKKWVTDMGEDVEMRDQSGSVTIIGRYGVWEDKAGKPECIDCSRDLNSLLERYGLSSDDVFVMSRKLSPRNRTP